MESISCGGCDTPALIRPYEPDPAGWFSLFLATPEGLSEHLDLFCSRACLLRSLVTETAIEAAS
jgi:hypothetical protein